MILRFRHKGLEALFLRGEAQRVSPRDVKRLRLILSALATAASPGDMKLPGLRLHPLKGDRKGQWAVMVSGNWRVVFAFDGEHVTDVDLLTITEG